MDQIDEVRRKTDIVELISQYVSLKKAGRNYKGLCPFHEEKTPSFMISPERQIFKCFGCGEGGDAFGFLMKKEGMEFGEALRFLAQKTGVELKDFRPSGAQKLKERLLEINHLAGEYYHFLLTEHKSGKEGLKYLTDRGVIKDSIRLFKLGFSPNEWEGLSNFLTRKKGYKTQELEQAGLVIKGNSGRFYDRFRGRIMFPLFDHRGRIMGFSGRVLDPEVKEAKYVNSPETILYHKSAILYGLETTKEAIKKANRAIVVEGELDLIASYQVGVKNIVAIKGSALTEEQIDLLMRFSENLSLALDSDAAGDAASRRGIELAENRGLNIRVIRVKAGKDPDECVRISSRLWKDSVKEAVPIYDFYLDSGVKKYGVKTIEGKRKLIEEMAKILGKIENEVIKDHYIKKLAKVLGVEEGSVSLEVEKSGLNRPREFQAKVVKTESIPRQTRLEEYLLAMILQSETEVKSLVSQVEPELLGETVTRKVLEKLKAWFKTGKEWQINKFVKSLPEELVAQVDAAYLLDLGRLAEDQDKLTRELDRTLTEIKRLEVKQKLQELSALISQAEKAKDKVRLSQLQKEFREMAKGLI
ncbi:MAG: DNA primase [Candidatus Beckwithbacteria bacterium]